MFIDIFLIILLVWGAVSGWRDGLLREVLNFVGFLVGMLFALAIYTLSGDFLAVNGSESNMVLSIGAFLILCVVIPVVFGTLGALLTRFMNFTPFLSVPNRLGGVVFGMAKFVLLASFCFNLMQSLGIMNEMRTVDSRAYEPVCAILPFLQEKTDPNWELWKESMQQTDTIFIDMSPTERLRDSR